MTEYWISKKQYWCKYCSIWIRDDAPSRRQHETGLRHIGAKERFIRDLYKTGNIAKRDKEQEAQEMARIEAAAEAAHAADTGIAGPSRKSVLYTQSHKAGSSAVAKPIKSGDKFANYSTASQLGLVDDETPQPTTFEIEQMLKNKETKVGQWEAVAEPTGLYSGSSGIRNEHAADGEEETEGWKFQHKGKRPVRDPYDDDDFDPSAILKMRKKVKQNGEEVPAPAPVPVDIPTAEELDKRDGALNRDKWSGKIELTNGDTSGNGGEGADAHSSPKPTFQSGGGWVKLDGGALATASASQTLAQTDNSSNQSQAGTTEEDSKPVLPETREEKPVVEKEGEVIPAAVAVGCEASNSGLFKKRRPPPSSRKK